MLLIFAPMLNPPAFVNPPAPNAANTGAAPGPIAAWAPSFGGAAIEPAPVTKFTAS